jgi:CheY-like chemotaxis protein
VSSSSSQIRALVVEDSPDIADLVRRSLEGDGLRVEVVSNLTSARAHLEQNLPDVVVLDVELPDDSGAELLRDRFALRDIPAVILSGRQDEIDRVRALSSAPRTTSWSRSSRRRSSQPACRSPQVVVAYMVPLSASSANWSSAATRLQPLREVVPGGVDRGRGDACACAAFGQCVSEGA